APPRNKPQAEQSKGRRRSAEAESSNEPPPWVGGGESGGGSGGGGYDDDSYDSYDASDPMFAGATVASGRGGDGGAVRGGAGRPQRGAALPQDGPEIEALRLLIHRRNDIEGWL